LPYRPMSQAPTHAAPDFYQQLGALVERFDPISLAEMDAVALLNRVDLKYMLTLQDLLGALETIVPYYRILSVAQVRLNRYQTLYFDTPEFSLYRQHHNGSQNRHKVRFRRYVDSDLAFLEIKHKDNKDRTQKKRLRVLAITDTFDDKMRQFLSNALLIDPARLEAKLWNHFIRITLVSKQTIERLTLDLDLRFDAGTQIRYMSGLAIAEVKQEHLSRQSCFVQQMRRLCVYPLNFSKYCIGAALHFPSLKQNNFKPVFLRMRKLGSAALPETL
jgi:hypothetical protein